MKPVVCIFYVLVVTVYLGSTLGNEEGGEVRDCPLQTSQRRQELETVKESMIILARCLNRSSNSDLTQLGSLNGIDEHREFFKNLCGGLPATGECLAVETTKWNNCYNETMAKVFAIFVDLVETSLQKGCVEDGDSLATITDGYHRYTADYRARNPFVRECIIYITQRWKAVIRSEASLATKIWFLYREFQNFKQCYVEYIPDELLVTISVEHMDEALDKMKCLHPTDETLVLCKSIDSSSIDRASACPIKTRNETLSPLNMMLERRLQSCFIVYEPYGQQLLNATTIEEFRSYFGNYCRRQGGVKHCLNETTTGAKICLHDPQYKTFKLMRDYFDTALDAGCFEEGKRLASMFYESKILQNNTDQQDSLMKCLGASRGTRTQSFDDPSRLYQFYQELPVIRQCFVDKAGGDTTFVDHVNGFINDMMAKMKCVNTEDESIVLCQTIASN